MRLCPKPFTEEELPQLWLKQKSHVEYNSIYFSWNCVWRLLGFPHFDNLLVLKQDFSDSLLIAIIEKKIFSRYIDLNDENWKAFIACLLNCKSLHILLWEHWIPSDGHYKILLSFACLCGDTNQKMPDMGNPTVGLVYYTATLHYNCSFKSSLPYIATLL